MTDIFAKACSTYGVVIDSNLLIVLLIGLHDKNQISKSNLTSGFTEDDFEVIRNVAWKSVKVIITPHILAELSNLLVDRTRGKRGEILHSPYLEKTIGLLREAEEKYISKNDIIDCEESPRLGFTDLAVAQVAAKTKCAVLTNDGELYEKLVEMSCAVANTATLVAIKNPLRS
jgi:rRNA-processing protein FCF1